MELTGWFAYLRVDDEVQTQRLTIALVRAFGGGKAQPQQPDDDEKPIDTTAPGFAEKFKGFTNTPVQQSRPQRIQSTEIKIG